MLKHEAAPIEDIAAFARDSFDSAVAAASIDELKAPMLVGGNSVTKWKVPVAATNTPYELVVSRTIERPGYPSSCVEDNDAVVLRLIHQGDNSVKYVARVSKDEGVAAPYSRSCSHPHSEESVARVAKISSYILGIRDEEDLFPAVQALSSDPAVSWQAQKNDFIVTDDLRDVEYGIRLIASETYGDNPKTATKNVLYRDPRRQVDAVLPPDQATPEELHYNYRVIGSAPPYGELSSDLLAMMSEYREIAINSIVDRIIAQKQARAKLSATRSPDQS